ncbi:MAG: TetR/AcrR family transcriptional regulator [Ornithinimicrobium sp.]|uniref:TetR/AcrR family transcriptional regulator n=1 Tax=Ornithinimicrobium sp. TaxID=1977084 RepID=UPI003D9B72BF
MAADSVVRYARGAHRRSVLIEAAGDLLLEQGRAALSHRAVAARAGLPLASTTYYFASADDLRDEALQHVAEAWVARAGAVVDALPAQLDAAQAAQAVVSVIGADAPRQQILLMYERYLEAGRHQRLRPVVAAWNAALKEVVRQVLIRADLPAEEDNARLVLAVADGVAVTALAEGTPADVAVGAALVVMFSLL